jgi:hypothetical protein
MIRRYWCKWFHKGYYIDIKPWDNMREVESHFCTRCLWYIMKEKDDKA